MASFAATTIWKPYHVFETGAQPGEQRSFPAPGEPPQSRRLDSLLLRPFNIAEGSALLMAAFLTSALLGIVRQVLFNARFGVGPEASAYYAAFRLPDTIATLLAGGALGNALIPVLLVVAHSEGEGAARRLANLVFTILTVLVTPITLLCIALAPLLVTRIIAPGFDNATSELAVALTRLMLLELLFVVAMAVGSAVLSSESRFLLPALAIAITNVTFIGGIALAMLVPSVGVYGPAWGAVGDVFLQLIILAYGLRRIGFRFQLVWSVTDRYLRAVVRLLIPNGLSAGVNYGGAVVDTALASLASIAAGLPALFNAYLLIGLPIRLLGVAVAQAAFPRLAAHAASGDQGQLRRTLLGSLALATLLGLAATGALAIVGRPLVRLLFERGQFDAAAGTLTFTLFLIYLIGLPAYIATELFTRGLIALHDTRTPLITNCLQLGGRILIIVALIGSYDIFVVPFAFAVTSAVEAAMLGLILLRRIRA